MKSITQISFGAEGDLRSERTFAATFRLGRLFLICKPSSTYSR